jgi:uncharacterized SAM-binding protein YcdF (DUF218 family)
MAAIATLRQVTPWAVRVTVVTSPWTAFCFATYAVSLGIWVLGSAVDTDSTTTAQTVQVELVPLATKSPPLSFKFLQDSMDDLGKLTPHVMC